MGNKKKKMGIVILHGWSYSTEKWKPFLKLLEQNGVAYEMLRIPGLTVPLKSVWTLVDYVDWLDKQVISHKSQVILLGHSNGGRIVAAFAAKYPEKVTYLILIDSAGIVHRNLETLLKRTLFGTAAKLGKKITKSDSIRNLFYKAVGEQDYNKADPILKKTMLNLISQDLESTFSDIKVPTFIIWGEDDKITPLSDGRKIHKLISGSKFEIIKGVKHSPQFTNPEEVFEIIKQNL